MSNRAMLNRRSRPLSHTYWEERFIPRQKRFLRAVHRPGYGMGMGANTLIHNGRKP